MYVQWALLICRLSIANFSTCGCWAFSWGPHRTSWKHFPDSTRSHFQFVPATSSCVCKGWKSLLVCTSEVLQLYISLSMEFDIGGGILEQIHDGGYGGPLYIHMSVFGRAAVKGSKCGKLIKTVSGETTSGMMGLLGICWALSNSLVYQWKIRGGELCKHQGDRERQSGGVLTFFFPLLPSTVREGEEDAGLQLPQTSSNSCLSSTRMADWRGQQMDGLGADQFTAPPTFLPQKKCSCHFMDRPALAVSHQIHNPT